MCRKCSASIATTNIWTCPHARNNRSRVNYFAGVCNDPKSICANRMEISNHWRLNGRVYIWRDVLRTPANIMYYCSKNQNESFRWLITNNELCSTLSLNAKFIGFVVFVINCFVLQRLFVGIDLRVNRQKFAWLCNL